MDKFLVLKTSHVTFKPTERSVLRTSLLDIPELEIILNVRKEFFFYLKHSPQL